MRIKIITVSGRPPQWCIDAYQEYVKRFSSIWPIETINIPLRRSNQNDNKSQNIVAESKAILATIPSNALIVALDSRGQSWDNSSLAKQFEQWQQQAQTLCFIIGGPDGLSAECLQRVSYSWSLSPLTFPHQLVRVILAEQIYRTFCILNHHPYHR